MKRAIFISSGLGNALLTLPMLHRLKKRGGALHGIFTSPFQCDELFEFSDLFASEKILLNDLSLLSFALSHLNYFDEVYLDHLSSSRKNLIIAHFISKKIITHQIPVNLPAFFRKKISFIQPEKNIHESQQYLRLIGENVPLTNIAPQEFKLVSEKKSLPGSDYTKFSELRKKKYFAVQIIAGHNTAKHKNWSQQNWIAFLKLATEKFPEHNFILLGHEYEQEHDKMILAQNFSNVFSLVGKTSISELMQIMNGSMLYIGLDSGLMHLAHVLGKPSITVWGASDYNLYGYQNFNQEKNKIVYHKLSCWPCNSWIAPNTSRVTDPFLCPDFACLGNISPEKMFSEFMTFAEIHLPKTA